MLIISVDPGNGTGMDFYITHPGGSVNRYSYEIYGLQEVAEQLELWQHTTALWGDPVHLAVEEYTMTSGGPKTAQPLALKIMGMAEYLAAKFGWTHHYYRPTACKKLCDNTMLRKLGWWQPTKDGHINDSRRVTLTCMANVFPEEFGKLTGI